MRICRGFGSAFFSREISFQLLTKSHSRVIVSSLFTLKINSSIVDPLFLIPERLIHEIERERERDDESRFGKEILAVLGTASSYR